MSTSDSNFKQALWLGMGQLCTFALSFISAAILSRFFDKVEYGTYKQILYVYNTLQTLFTVGLPSVFSYFIPRLEHGQQKFLIKGLNRVLLLLGFVFSLSLFFLSDFIADLLNNQELSRGLKIFSPFPLFTLPAMGVEGIYTALRNTRSIAVYTIISKTLMLLCILFPVLCLHTGYEGAIIGWGFASLLTFIVAMYMKRKPFLHVQEQLVEKMYQTIFNYSLPLMGAFVAGFFLHSADQFFVSRYYGTVTFAVFSNGCLAIPLATMISSSVKNVLLPLFSKSEKDGNMLQAVTTYKNAVKRSIVLVFPILIFCIFFSQEIMVFVFGQQYAESHTYFRLYTIREFVAVLPYYSVLLALGLTRVYMYMHLLGTIYIWLADFIIVSYGLSSEFIVLISSSFSIFCSIFAFNYIYRQRNVNLITWDLVMYMLKVILHCIIILYAIRLLISCFFICGQPVIVLISGVVLFYLLLLLTGKILRINYFESFLQLINRRVK